jgi:hypothetical protein
MSTEIRVEETSDLEAAASGHERPAQREFLLPMRRAVILKLSAVRWLDRPDWIDQTDRN